MDNQQLPSPPENLNEFVEPDPYTFPALLQLKPGSLFMGFAIHKQHQCAKPAKAWYVHMARRRGWEYGEDFPLDVILERSVRWRTNFKDRQQVVSKNGVSFYSLTRGELLRNLITNQGFAMNIKFKYQMPVGIFLGHIIRVDDGSCYVNILSPEGYDIWIGS